MRILFFTLIMLMSRLSAQDPAFFEEDISDSLIDEENKETMRTMMIWKLTEGASHKTDVTNASRTMLFNIEEQKWDEDLLNLFGIPRSMLPEVCDNVFDFGTTNVLGGEVSIGGVAGDQQAALIGQCCVSLERLRVRMELVAS